MSATDEPIHADSGSATPALPADTTAFAYRLQWLYDHQPDPRTLLEATPRFFNDGTLAVRIQEMGEDVSNTTLWNLRRGVIKNPKFNLVEAIASAFGRTAIFFSKTYSIEQAEAEMRLLEALRHEDIRTLALRASQLSPDALQPIIDIVARLDAFKEAPQLELPPRPRPRQRRKQ